MKKPGCRRLSAPKSRQRAIHFCRRKYHVRRSANDSKGSGPALAPDFMNSIRLTVPLFVGSFVALVVELFISFIYIPSSVKNTLQLRCGQIETLGSRAFNEQRRPISEQCRSTLEFCCGRGG